MVVCEFSYSLVIQTIGVVGTLAIAALAIWGEQIRHRVAGPKLSLRLHDPEGGLTTWTNSTKVRYYHLYVENRRPHAPATRVKVMMREYYSCGPHGKFVRDANHRYSCNMNFQTCRITIQDQRLARPRSAILVL